MKLSRFVLPMLATASILGPMVAQPSAEAATYIYNKNGQRQRVIHVYQKPRVHYYNPVAGVIVALIIVGAIVLLVVITR
ncbi:MAG: hypothetical protein ACRCXZ_03160 [Patescibacteria group bacterium]